MYLRIVLARFELAANDGHFGEQVLALDVAVDEAVGFQADAEFEIGVGPFHRLEIVGPVHPGCAVEGGTALAKRFGDVAMSRRALEKHVLQQVRHARFAVAFVARPDQDG